MDEMEWMEVFETKKAEAQAIKTEIDKTDKEIDQMVYELYGLTDEEITIVEGGV
jgi:type II restriction/modification system DNA methylase subunit YeeA